MSLENLANEYFKAFSNKEIDTLSKLYSEEVNLRDWKVDINGLENVLNANKETFRKLPNIKINLISIASTNNKVFSEIIIDLDDSSSIQVVDIIEFDSKLKIRKVKAYKG